MKLSLLVFFTMFMAFNNYAQDKSKSSKPTKFKFTKVSRDVKKETRKYKDEKWMVLPGNPPIEQQLNNAFNKQMETDDEGFPRWIISNGASVAQTQAAAQMQATELAKNNLIGLIETQMKSVVEIDLSNNQLNAQEAVTVSKTIQVATNKVSKKLGMVQPLFQIYRPVNSNNTEVQILISYSYELARKMILEEMKLELQLETEDVRKKYDRFLNPDYYKQGDVKNVAENSSR